MSGLRGRSAVAADHRSALPRVPGIPWWAAAIVAVVVTALGVAYDAGSGSDALGAVFATCYVLGCVAAVVAVRQSGIFTAVIQPPLILFVAVPFAYFVITGSTFTGIKDTLINCGYPLIERFPLMFFTSATVLLIGMIRWYLGAAARRATPKDTDATLDAPEEVPATATPKESGAGTKPRRSSRTATTRAAATAATAGKAAASAMDDESPRAPRRNPRPPGSGAQRSAGAAAGTGTGTGSRRSRHSRPPETELDEPAGSRPRRRNTPPVDPPAEPRRRPRPRSGEPRDRDPRDRDRDRDRDREPRDRRPLPPLDRRNGPRERPQERYDRPERAPRRPRSADYEAYDPPPSNRTNGSNGTHHPVSRVRYRGADEGESRTEHRTTPRRPRHSAPDSWEYDV
ncbi:DUF6542 domain-containing protein [Mycobacterium antarcticum]|uniref:DUF6542 domain-containing protein n=1 Tax=unclassified Mycolicibacterium TaxID=2636767 RepID=UPI0024E043D8|nr:MULTISPECIES: DUF6542 domain-containing protein [unclassified Mycolicibacterium]